VTALRGQWSLVPTRHALVCLEADRWPELAAASQNFPMQSRECKPMTRPEAVISPTVLLVQSEPAARSDVAISLNKTGFNVIEAARAGEAWTTLEARPDVQVLLTDLDVSSGADGLEFARKVHDRWPSIGLVITSGHVRHLRPDDVPGDGCFLPRPFPAETLLHEVKVAAHQITT
jgi:DNA-binding NtrC family response regulator